MRRDKIGAHDGPLEKEEEPMTAAAGGRLVGTLGAVLPNFSI